ncbi:enoyl-CoA hydratase-related protein [Kineosporia babensis]|uniref:Enoyl-CoA hydratase-related protein n=1 Tax=Kineosporia babensis TaxID=499548 RepID=A0A9X1SVI0_9ACTN|nr:enoyl-CoA hydratase-related protein [Kineosporia babensis]MCD5314007.1 enoyl-CoA hydratase-related protein [Kineosporia babensis]
MAEIAYAVQDNVATIVLDRPARLNAFTLAMGHELIEAFARADADDEVRVVVVTGRGRAFCAGADLALGAETFDATRNSLEADADSAQTRPQSGLNGFGRIGEVPRDPGGAVSLAIASCRKPVIGAINGPAVGVGATMTLPMDVRIASEAARFGFVFTQRGLVPEAASAWFLPRVVGISQAMEWVATGRVFGATEAREGGLVSRVVAKDELLPAAYRWAAEIVDNTSAVAVGAARQLLWSMLGAASPWDAHALDSQLINELGRGADAAEGVTSFLEKRPARFTGRVSTDHPATLPPWPGPSRNGG